MSERPWHSRPFLYILLFQLVILSYVSLTWTPGLTGLLFSSSGLFHLAGTLAFFLAAFLALLAFLQAILSFRLAGMNFIKIFALLVLAGWFLLLGITRMGWEQQWLALTGPAPAGLLNTPLPVMLALSIFWLGYTLLLPLAARLWPDAGSLLERFIPIPGLQIGLLFALNFALAAASPFLFQHFYKLADVPFVQAVLEVHHALAGLFCALIAMDLQWQVNDNLGHARARLLLGRRRRRVIVQPLQQRQPELQDDAPTRPNFSIPPHTPADGETRPTRVKI
jgi:hypothetical protein